MTALRPRELIHRGTVFAAGVLIDTGVVDADDARLRVLALWAPGATVHLVDGGLVVVWPEPRWLESRFAPGLALVRDGALLSTAPLDPKERATLPPGASGLLRVRGGTAVIEPIPAPVDPSAWLETGHLAPVSVATLGAPPPPPVAAVPDPPPVTRKAFAGVGDQAPESVALLQELDQRATGAEGTRVGSSTRSGFWSFLAALASGLMAQRSAGADTRARSATRPGFWSFLTAPISELLPRKRSARALPAGANARGAQPGWWTRFTQTFLMRALEWTRLGRVIGHRQAQYVRELVDLFSEGQLDEALRRAIPVDGPLSPGAKLMLGTPAPRTELSVNAREKAAGSVMGAGPDLQSLFKRLYRDAFKKLERQGRIDEAAFVLAELLHSNLEAVSFLERHGRLRLAAEIAEARSLPPPVVIRQWVLAGDVKRAMVIARRTGAFAQAIALLQRGNPEQARTLRMLWAELLAEAGDFDRAVQVIWEVPQARGLASKWIDRAIELGGPGGAAMLARKIVLMPNSLAELAPSVQALLDDDDPQRASERRAFSRVVCLERPGPVVGVLARPALRAMIRETASGDNEAASLISKLRQSVDGAMTTDLPQIPVAIADGIAQREIPLVIDVEATRTGTLVLHDVARLPDGRFLLAAGEAGVLLVTRDGRRVAQFATPAHGLSVSDSGLGAIAVAYRGMVSRLSRIDLAELRSRTWCDAGINSSFAKTYDGEKWFCILGNTLAAVDALGGADLRTLWSLPDSCALLVERSPAGLSAFMMPPPHYEAWHYELPSLTLRRRRTIPTESHLSALGPDDSALTTQVHRGEQLSISAEIWREGDHRSLLLPDVDGRALYWRGPALLRDGFVMMSANGYAVRSPERVTREGPLVHELYVFDEEVLQLRLKVRLHGASSVHARLMDGYLVACDERGRVVSVDLRTGQVTSFTV